MAVLPILTYPDPRLKRVAEPVTAFDADLHRFLADLRETMEAGPGGVGIAAPQVDRPLRICLVDCSRARKPCPNHGYLELINPEIVEWSGMEVGREGCMSIPDYTANVVRATEVVVQFQDREGAERVVRAEGFEARAIQHELDHLEGVLFIDRVVSKRRDVFPRKRYR
ncbi:MAG: peptide deformylase [Nitrospirae bacterium]|nr:MAG: peptide deformylase [Nitrospirota bacterium]